MMISNETAAVLADLIENKLAVLDVDGREELREVLTLQRCLAEIKGFDAVPNNGLLKSFEGVTIPTRGRRRKISGIVGAA
jgi:hypothetical protein